MAVRHDADGQVSLLWKATDDGSFLPSFLPRRSSISVVAVLVLGASPIAAGGQTNFSAPLSFRNGNSLLDPEQGFICGELTSAMDQLPLPDSEILEIEMRLIGDWSRTLGDASSYSGAEVALSAKLDDGCREISSLSRVTIVPRTPAVPRQHSSWNPLA